MDLLPVRTKLLTPGTDPAACIQSACSLEDDDILVISSKAVATCEGAAVDLHSLAVTPEADELAGRCGCSPAFCQAVLRETERLHGSVIGTCPQALLCEVRPDGFTDGTLLTVNAGLDCSNAQQGSAVGWPHDPVTSTRSLRKALEDTTGKRIAVILSDSCCSPRRLGVTAIALTSCGLDPHVSQVGTKDLFGRKLTVTHEARADQLATAANMLMGNAAGQTPAVIIRSHGCDLSDFCGWVPGIGPEEDLFGGAVDRKR